MKQVANLRPVQVVAVTGGKGGVGKTSICANLGVSLARRGHETMVLDADLGLANLQFQFGLRPRYNLSHVIDGSAKLEDIILSGPAGLKVVPGASGLSHMACLTRAEQAGLIQAFSELTMPLEYLLVDTAAGITPEVVSFACAAQEVVIVACDVPASLADAYALIKVLNLEHQIGRFHLLANMVKGPKEGRRLYEKLLAVTDRFLDVLLSYFGAIPFDPQFHKAVQRQRAVVDLFPRCASAVAFDSLAAELTRWPITSGPSGFLEFFLERSLGAASAGERSQTG
ncbi:MinD/ParA family ATP-binding protein [Thioflavicoccus mobilis]|uniref:MinD/ParA family ATP-binding protein n=1 Tax=Thioflavicoccus mobilis TaxID=80679 RepID=UPI001C109445|nr:MinD/ParA family protein [Thioflavicoccus mobilis]